MAADGENPAGGALAGTRMRVIISSDIGGYDPDDFQSLVHYLVYANHFDTEGLISSPPGPGRVEHIHAVLDAYAQDYPALASHATGFPTPDALRAVAKQGAIDPAPAVGFSTPSEGSDWIIARAKRDDPRPLYVLVWGSITDVAQAVHDAPEIAGKLRVYSIGSWNTKQDPAARAYLDARHPGLWWVEADTTFRGMYVGGRQDDDLENAEFLARHVRGHGALGDFLYAKKTSIKMGDTPSVLYLLRGDPASPTTPHWGGQFAADPDRLTHWIDDPNPAAAERQYPGAKTVNQWREAYLRDWEARMDWCTASSSQQ